MAGRVQLGCGISIRRARAGVYHIDLRDEDEPKWRGRMIVYGELDGDTPEAVFRLVKSHALRSGVYFHAAMPLDGPTDSQVVRAVHSVVAS